MPVKEITLLASPTSGEQAGIFKAALRGIQKHGVKAHIQPSNSYAGTKAVACWGWRKGQELRRSGHEVLVFERAYLGDRFKWISLAWNGLNGYGDFCLPPEVTTKRFEDNFEPLAPWKNGGDYILLAGQIIGDMSLQGKDLTKFYEEAADKLGKIHRLPVFFRPHPHVKGARRNFEPRLNALGGTLEEAIDNAALVVTWNSNTGVDAVTRGVPAMSFDKGSMAYGVTSHDFSDSIKKPDRTAWAARLAHCQFTPDEIDEGEWWERYAKREA